MKTLLISPMWLDSTEEDSMKRHTKWLDFIIPLKEKLGYDRIFLVDNASSQVKLDSILTQYPDILIHRCSKHIPRREHLKYGYWYAALAIAGRYALDMRYEKIIYIDTDMYPMSDRMCEYTKRLTTGWTGLWCHLHKFPETNYQIIGPDKLQAFYDFHSRDFLTFYPDKDAESQTPFTRIEKGLVGDRYGEMNVAPAAGMDYYGQCRVETEVKFNA
jgi:hypothetical protein